jgi:energy-converting hydrogenase Eha subunit B
MTTTMNRTERTPSVARDTGMTARVTVAWAMAGGVAAGGFFVAAMNLTGRLSGSGVLLAAGGMFLIGAMAGFMAGALLGYLGRPADVNADEGTRGLFMALLWAVPGLAAAFLVTGWIAATGVVLFAGNAVPVAFMVAAWLVGAAMVGGAFVEAAGALANIRTRLARGVGEAYTRAERPGLAR